MTQTRRDFLRTTAAAALVGVLPSTSARPVRQDSAPTKGLKILILGGTNFLGPACVEAARARGHTVTLFNRGKHNPDWFPDVEKLHGDRDPKKDKGLSALKDRKWDAVLDNSGYYPRTVKASAELLAPNVGHYTFVSTLSVYADTETENQDETGKLLTIADPTVETMGKEFENYGPLKALCEKAAEEAMPGRVAVVRPTYIVGPGDTSDRFTYWPARFARGGDVLVPGTPQDPVQIIDVRDLAEWMIRLAEAKTAGVFNALGPVPPLKWGTLVEACQAAGNKTAKPIWVNAEFMAKFIKPDDDVGIPIWIPPVGKTKGFHTFSAARSVKAGLTYRPVATTVNDTLKWWNSQTEERRAKPRAGLTPEKETEILTAWAKSQAK